MAIIPRLRRPVLVLGRQRQLTARQLAGRIAETVDGVHEIHVHGTSNYERADISERLGRIFRIRFDLYQRKFVVKFLNNFLSQVTPFVFYLVGGYFAITGQLDIGALVGVMLAYKDLPSPIKELIDWDQQRLDVQIKYEQVVEQFQPEGMMAPSELQAIPDGPPPPLGRELALAGVTVSEDGRVKLLDSVSLVAADLQQARGDRRLELGQGRAWARCWRGSRLPSGGSIKLDGNDFFQLPEYVLGARTSLCRAGDLSVPAVGARQPAVRPEASGRSRRPSYDDKATAERELFWQGGRARRQSVARSQRRLDRLRAGRRHRPGRPAAAHGRGAEAGRARRGHLCARPARRDRSGDRGPISPRGS